MTDLQKRRYLTAFQVIFFAYFTSDCLCGLILLSSSDFANYYSLKRNLILVAISKILSSAGGILAVIQIKKCLINPSLKHTNISIEFVVALGLQILSDMLYSVIGHPILVRICLYGFIMYYYVNWRTTRLKKCLLIVPAAELLLFMYLLLCNSFAFAGDDTLDFNDLMSVCSSIVFNYMIAALFVFAYFLVRRIEKNSSGENEYKVDVLEYMDHISAERNMGKIDEAEYERKRKAVVENILPYIYEKEKENRG